MCVDHPTTHKYTIGYLVKSVNWDAGVKHIHIYLGKNNLHFKKQRDTITLYVGCARCGGYLLHLCASEGSV